MQGIFLAYDCPLSFSQHHALFDTEANVRRWSRGIFRFALNLIPLKNRL